MPPTDNVTDFTKGNVRDQIDGINIIPQNAENFKGADIKPSQSGGYDYENEALKYDKSNGF